MLARSSFARLTCAAAACTLLAGSGRAAAETAVVGAAHATEIRVAFAQSSDYTSVWTSARIEDDAGPFALILPLPDGAFVDQSSDAWFEALEASTAPRVFPPPGLNPYCPGQSGPADPFDIAAPIGHLTSVAPETIAVVDDAAAASTWASSQGLSLSADVQSALAALAGTKLLCVRFTTPGGVVVTPALRVTAPKGLPALPFSITRAGASNLRVSAWFLGDGRASLTGTTTSIVPSDALTWNAKTGASSYRAFTDEILAAQPTSVLLESSGHDVLVDPAPIANGSAFIDAFAQTYFERASAYGNASADPDPCINASKIALASAKAVGAQCPRGDLAALAGPCTQAPPDAGELDPAALLCGPGADDLAVALSGAVPAEAWLTRRTFVIAQGAAGKDRAVSFAAGAEVVPVLQTGSVDLGDCFGGSGGTSSSSSSTGAGGASGSTSGSGGASTGGTHAGGSTSAGGGTSNGGAGGTDVYVDTSGCACTGTYVESTSDTTPPPQDDCGSDTTGTTSSGDDCSSDTTGTTSSGDDCSSDTTGTTSGDDCSSGTSSGSSDSCSSDTSGGSSSPSDCSMSHRPAARRRGGPKLSVLMMASLALLLPLRRRGTRKKRYAVRSASR